jgi:hypothetical protein
MAGRCYTELRRPLKAEPLLSQALSDYDDTHARETALYLSWQQRHTSKHARSRTHAPPQPDRLHLPTRSTPHEQPTASKPCECSYDPTAAVLPSASSKTSTPLSLSRADSACVRLFPTRSRGPHDRSSPAGSDHRHPPVVAGLSLSRGAGAGRLPFGAMLPSHATVSLRVIAFGRLLCSTQGHPRTRSSPRAVRT